MINLLKKSRQRVECSLVLVSLSILSGCTLMHRLEQQEGRVKQTTDLIDQKHRTFEIATRTPQDKARAQSIDKPWLMGRAVPLAREVSLPSALRTKIDTTLM